MSNLVHAHHVLALDIDIARKSQVPFEGSGKVILLNVFGGVDQSIHQNEKMVGPVMPFLMLKQKIHEGLFEAYHFTPPFLDRLAKSHNLLPDPMAVSG
jgi:hypothetical protein